MEVIWPDYYPYGKNSQRKILPDREKIQTPVIKWASRIEHAEIFIKRRAWCLQDFSKTLREP